MKTKTIEALPGNHIATVCKNAVEMARQENCHVEFDFNGIKFIATPETDPDQLVQSYYDECGRRHSKYLASLESKPPQPEAEAKSLVGVASADLLAFSSILGGLLASGHFTRPPDDDSDESELIRVDYGKEWREDRAGDSLVYRRHVPCAIEAAEELFTAARSFCKANAEVRDRHPEGGNENHENRAGGGSLH